MWTTGVSEKKRVFFFFFCEAGSKKKKGKDERNSTSSSLHLKSFLKKTPGHAGGLVGGAMTAFLLGPKMVRRDEGKKRRVCDEPPCRWLAGSPIEMK